MNYNSKLSTCGHVVSDLVPRSVGFESRAWHRRLKSMLNCMPWSNYNNNKHVIMCNLKT